MSESRMDENSLIIIQARMSSRRLPGKVLRYMAGTPMLKLLIDRIGPQWKQHLVVATSTRTSDNPIEDECRKWDVDVVRGDLEDVLSRFIDAIDVYNPKRVIRLTGDNPMVDHVAIETALKVWTETEESIVGISNHLHDRCDPYGYCVEVFSAKALLSLAHSETTPEEKEHVTLGLRNRGLFESFQILNGEHSEIRWTVDYPEDFEYMDALFQELGRHATIREALEWSGEHTHPLSEKTRASGGSAQ